MSSAELYVNRRIQRTPDDTPGSKGSAANYEFQEFPKAPAAQGKPTNPKDSLGVLKVPLQLLSPIAKAFQAVAHYLGATKYGAWNWRGVGVKGSIYYAAAQRHLDQWYSGEDMDDDGTPHLANAAACINILIEAQYQGNMIDDRPPKVDLRLAYKDVEKAMRVVREKYGHMEPKQWTINDVV